ncbi:MAG TPA: hypothetical protein VFI47_14040 [Acidimicrobiales bacterium]|nr:hypothetical protein [Acidimicrobiales bacterium]
MDAGTWRNVATTLARVGAAAAGVVALSGVPLIWLYRPHGSLSWLRSLHGLSATVLLGAAGGLLVVAFVAAARRHAAGVTRTAAAAAFALATVGTTTGGLLAWDWIGLRAVTVGDDRRGVLAAVGDDVRFAIVGGREVSPGAYLAWALVHVVLVPAAAVAAAWWWARRRAPEPPGPGREAAVSDHGESGPV